MSTKRLNIDILAKDKTKQALSGVQKNLSNVKNTVFSLKGALVGLGAGAVIKSFVDVGKEVESLQVRFKFLFGSVEEGSLAFDNLTKFASKVPFSLEEISRASGNLAVVADDANDLNRILEITGNVAAVTGLDFETTSSQIQRAFSGGIGAADLFRERGVRALLGFKQGATVTAEETVARFEELFSGDGQFAKATDDLSQTLEGTLSMIGDKYFKFQKDVASGFFDELKGEFGDLNTFLEENEQQIKDIATAIGENFAGAITTTSENLKKIAPTVKTIADALGNTINGFASLPPFVRDVGLVGALIFGKKGALALAGVSFLVGQIQELVDRAEELQNIKTRPIVDIENIDEARTKLNQAIPFIEGLEDKLSRNGIDIFNLENIDLADKNLSKPIKEMIEKVIQGRKDIDALTQKIAILNSLTLDTGDAYSYASSEISKYNEEVNKTFELAKNQAEGFGNAYIDSVLLANKETGMAVKIVEDLADSFVLANQQATAFGGAYIDAINKGNKGIDTSTEVLFPKFKKVLEDAGDTTAQLDTLFTNTFNSFADTLADSIMTGKFAFKDFARSVIADIARMIAKQQALILLQRVSGFFGGNLFGFNIGGLIPRANGGDVNAGQSYLVGERGAEMFVPNQSGTIIPNDKMGGTTNINFTINTVDAQGVDELLTNRRSTIINVINDALNRQGKEALV